MTTTEAIAVIANPSKPQWRKAIQAIERECAEPPAVITTTVEDPGAGVARQAIADGAQRLVVCGGDGTVREVAAGTAGSGIPVGVVPIGTANIFARNIHLAPRALAVNAARAVHGEARALDLGWATLHTADGGERRLPFLVLEVIGKDAATLLGTRANIKSRDGWLAYFESGARHLLHRPIPMEVALDDEPARQVQAWSVLAANCPRVPPGILVFPGADPTNGRLETLVASVRWPHQWAAVAAQGLRMPVRASALRYAACSRLRVTPSRPVPVQVDGDAVAGVISLTVTIDPASVRIVAGSQRPSA